MTQRYTTPELDELFDRYRLAPDSNVFAPLADACRKAGMIEEALLICARGVKANPRYTSGHVVQGKCFFDAERHADAEASFRRVLDLDDHNLVALKFLGIIRAERGDAADARVFFKHILDLDPEDRDIRRRLENLGEAPAPIPSAAAPAQPRASAPASRSASPPASAQASVVEEHIEELRAVEDDAFEGDPITLRDESVTPDEIATLTLADIYAAQGHAAKALRIYREVLRRQPGNESVLRKISALEVSEPRTDESASLEAFEPLPPMADAPVSESEPADDAAERVGRPALPPPTNGSPIDEGRSYEQFKRWLRAMSD